MIQERHPTNNLSYKMQYCETCFSLSYYYCVRYMNGSVKNLSIYNVFHY
jgi:hypothetical protein